MEFRVERLTPCVRLRFRLRRCPPCFLAGFCFLSAPEGRLGGLRLGTQGFREIHQTPSALREQRTRYKEFSDDYREQVRQGPRRYIRHHPARRRTMPRRHHELRGEARDCLL